MGAIRVHEFISFDGVIDTPSWTFQFGFDPRMGETIGQVGVESVEDTTYLAVSLKKGAPGSSSAVRLDQAGSNI